jgi:hypothetical protein
MKNKSLGIIAFIAVIALLLSGCATTTTNTQTNAGLGADELDTAIREASDYFNTRIPRGNKVAFINISGGYPDLADYILSDLSKHGVNDGVFSVVDRAQLEAVRSELNFNMSGEVSDQSAQAIGQMLGAQTIVSGSVRRIGTLYRLDVKAIEVQTASVQGQWNRNIPHGMTIAALTTNTGGGTATATAGGGQAVTGNTAAAGGTATPAAATAAPKAGTYIFFPRPQATRNGIPVDAYIYKIVVRGRNMLIYIGNEPRGPNTGYYSSTIFAFTYRNIITNLDRPSQSWSNVGESPRTGDNAQGGLISSFENVTTTRFSLEAGSNKEVIFDEINLSQAEYEP